MRYILTTIMALFLATPAFADNLMCSIEGPHNCQEQIEDYLIDDTRNTINAMQIARPEHAFKTQNDTVLQQASRNHAALNNNYAQQAPAYRW